MVKHLKEFFSETAWPIESKLHMWQLWDMGLQVCKYFLDRLSKVAAKMVPMTKHGKTFKWPLLRNYWAPEASTVHVFSSLQKIIIQDGHQDGHFDKCDKTFKQLL